jgi:hypothetical protein
MKKVIGIAAVVGLALGGIGSASADFSDYSEGFSVYMTPAEVAASPDVDFGSGQFIWGGVGCNCWVPQYDGSYIWQ